MLIVGRGGPRGPLAEPLESSGSKVGKKPWLPGARRASAWSAAGRPCHAMTAGLPRRCRGRVVVGEDLHAWAILQTPTGARLPEVSRGIGRG